MRCTSRLAAERERTATCACCRGGSAGSSGRALWLVAAHVRAVHVCLGSTSQAPTRRRVAWAYAGPSFSRASSTLSIALRLSPWHGAPLKRLACVRADT